MTDFGKKSQTAAGNSPAAASFQNLLALFFGIGWGGCFTALFADLAAAAPDFSVAVAESAAALIILLLLRKIARRFSPFFSVELLFLALSGVLLNGGWALCAALLLAGGAIFHALFGGEDFSAYRKKFAVGVLWGGVAVMLWELSFIPALLWLLATLALYLTVSQFRYRKRTAFCGILLCCLVFWMQHLHLDTRLFSKPVSGEAQGITLIAAAGTPECKDEPRALCITGNDHAAFFWQEWRLFNSFSVVRPGRTLPWGEKYDIIFCDRIPAGVNFRAGAIFKRLAPGGILAVPVEIAAKRPQLAWQTLPGSGKSFVAARPDDPEWKIVPEKLDASLFRGKNRKSASTIAPGALTGMLVDFHPERAQFPQKKTCKTVIFPGLTAWGIMLIFLTLHLAAFRRPKFSETLSIAENCLGFALLMTLIFRSLPKCVELLPVLMLFFFLYPLKIRNWLLKLTGALAIAAALLWSLVPCILLAVTALLLTGAEFSTTFNEQMAEKPKAGRLAAATGLACGILLAAAAEYMPFAFAHVVQAALLFRVWTLIRC